MRILLEDEYKHEFSNIDMDIFTFGHDEGDRAEIISPYRYYVNKSYGFERTQKKIFYNNLNLPKFWGIYVEGHNGKILDNGELKGYIYFQNPIISRYVKRVDWIDNGKVYKKDYYDCYGEKYYSEYIDSNDDINLISYYGKNGDEVLINHKKNEAFYLMNKGCVNKIMHSYKELVQCFLEDVGL